MSNYILIRFKRFVSSFTVKLWNKLFFSTVFNAPCMCRKIRCDEYCRNFFVKGSTLLLTSYTTCYIPSCTVGTQSSSGPGLQSGASRRYVVAAIRKAPPSVEDDNA